MAAPGQNIRIQLFLNSLTDVTESVSVSKMNMIPQDQDCTDTHRGTGRAELLQHVRDEYLEESLAEETLSHCAAVIVKFLNKKRGRKKKDRKIIIATIRVVSSTQEKNVCK